MSRVLIFRMIMVLLIAIILEAIGYTAMWVNSRSFDWLSNKNYFRVRAMLMGDSDGAQRPRYLTVPYLGYIPYPGYTKNGIVQHNDAGYRGTRAPLLRTDKLRVLCMGGSTTYGLGVDRPEQAYPAQVDSMLNEYIRHDSILSKEYTGAEVINAGLEAGTSAEELQQYLFKYRYYRPDVVVIHSGVNDAEVMNNTTDGFQLDYTHYRRLQFHLEPLPQPARFFMRSYFISFLSIRLFYENFYYSGVSGRQCYTRQQGQTFTRWNELDMGTVMDKKDYRYLPYYRNTKSLYEEIRRDSIALLVLPNILNIKDSFVISSPRYKQLCEDNIAMAASLTREAGGVNIPFTFDSIHDPHTWLDDCHLNASGERNKAQIVLPHIIKIALESRPISH